MAATIAPFIVAALHAAPDEHISSPAQCAQGAISCGPVKYEPQSGQGVSVGTATPVAVRGVFKKKPVYVAA
ncbi:hypothetical protein [Nocardia sp. NPDC050175]|uniref:hypothetical protein n=1 Tax=Nocardia sp. NPDC050175 TaxID=3364317 RepID=UPI0037ABFB9C